MSRIEELIERLCPDGVEFKELRECLEKNIGGGTPSRANTDYWNGNIPWASVGDLSLAGDFIHTTRSAITEEGLKNSPSNKIAKGSVIVAVKISPGKMKIAGTDIAINQDLRGLVLKPDLNNKFLVYYSNTISILGNGTIVKGITTSTLERIKIPVPPIEVQYEIVRILDLFTDLVANLEAELEARKTQFAFYRDALFRFEGENVVWKKLDEIGSFTRGKRFVKTDMLQKGFPCIHYGEMYTHYKIWAKEAKSFLDPALATKLRVAKPGDVIIVAAGETIEDIGQGVAWHGPSDVVIHDACFALSHNMHPNYVAHFLQTDIFHSQIRRHISSGKISSINAAGLGKAKIPIPPTEEQQRIAAILDKFHVLINDISIGIPAEIEARRQQYEYIRNRLLTFKNRSHG